MGGIKWTTYFETYFFKQEFKTFFSFLPEYLVCVSISLGAIQNPWITTDYIVQEIRAYPTLNHIYSLPNVWCKRNQIGPPLQAYVSNDITRKNTYNVIYPKNISQFWPDKIELAYLDEIIWKIYFRNQKDTNIQQCVSLDSPFHSSLLLENYKGKDYGLKMYFCGF